jgi:hypothetical protein
MKKIINVFKLFKLMYSNMGLFKVVEDIFKFVETTHEKQIPMVSKIALINTRDGTQFSDFVSLWAGIGECSPIERAKHLKAQNDELKRLLKIASKGLISKEDKELIDLTLKILD